MTNAATAPIEPRPGYAPVCPDALSRQICILAVAGFGPRKQFWELSILRQNQPDSPMPSVYEATHPIKLCALACSILRHAGRASLARAKTFLRARWCQL